jgi:hypothetical protein
MDAAVLESVASAFCEALACRTTVFCKTDCIWAMCASGFARARAEGRAFCLVTGMSDLRVDDALADQVLAACGASLLKWFAVNLACAPRQRLTSLPIGCPNERRPLVLHPHRAHRPNLLAVCINTRTNAARRAVVQDLRLAGFDNKDRLPKDEFEHLLRQSVFTASPIGNGLDCYRTWEALMLGSIPICDAAWEAGRRDFAHLPIVWVTSWKQVTRPFLEERASAFGEKHWEHVRTALCAQEWSRAFCIGAAAAPPSNKRSSVTDASGDVSFVGASFASLVAKERQTKTLICLNNDQTAVFVDTDPAFVYKMVKQGSITMRQVDELNHVHSVPILADQIARVARESGCASGEYSCSDGVMYYRQRRVFQCEPGDNIPRALSACLLLREGVRRGCVVGDLNGRQFGVDADGWVRMFDAHDLILFDHASFPPPGFVIRFALEQIEGFARKHFQSSFAACEIQEHVREDCRRELSSLGRSSNASVRSVAFEQFMHIVSNAIESLRSYHKSLRIATHGGASPLEYAHAPLVRVEMDRMCPMPDEVPPAASLDCSGLRDHLHQESLVAHAFRGRVHRLLNMPDRMHSLACVFCGDFIHKPTKKSPIFLARTGSGGALEFSKC